MSAFDNIDAFLSDLDATTSLLSHLARSKLPVSGELVQVRGRIDELVEHLREEIEAAEAEWEDKQQKHAEALATARAERAAPGSPRDIEDVNAAWSILKVTAEVVLAHYMEARNEALPIGAGVGEQS